MKRKLLSMLLTLCMVVTLMPGMAYATEGANAPTSVQIGRTPLVSGKYYTAVTGENKQYVLVEVAANQDSAPENGLRYENGILTVYGIVSLSSVGPNILTISGGTLTLAGDENSSLTLTASSTSVTPVDGGSSGSIATYQGFAGNLTFSGMEGATVPVLNNLVNVNLATTGDISITGKSVNTPLVRATGAVSLNANSLMTVNNVSNNSTTDKTLVTANTIALTATSESGITLTGKLLANTNGADAVTLSAPNGEITLFNYYGDMVRGSLTATAYGNIEIYSNEVNHIVLGNTSLTSENGEIVIKGKTDDIQCSELFIGSLTVNAAESIEISMEYGGNGSFVTGNADLTAGSSIDMNGNTTTKPLIYGKATFHVGSYTWLQSSGVAPFDSEKTTVSSGLLIVTQGENNQTKIVTTDGSITLPADIVVEELTVPLQLGADTRGESYLYVYDGIGYALWETVDGTDDKMTLTLHNLDIQVEDSTQIIKLPLTDSAVDSVNLVVKGENTLISGYQSIFAHHKNIILSGDGSLDVGNSGIYFEGEGAFETSESFNGSFNGLVRVNKNEAGYSHMSHMYYGNVTVDENNYHDAGASVKITENATVTVPVGECWYLNGISKLTNQGNIVNNGLIDFGINSYEKDKNWTLVEIRALGITGSGSILLNGILYKQTNNGLVGDITKNGLCWEDESALPAEVETFTAGAGTVTYTPAGNGSLPTLTLNNATLPQLTLKAAEKFLINVIGENTIKNPCYSDDEKWEDDSIVGLDKYGSLQANKIEFTGSGTLTVEGETDDDEQLPGIFLAWSESGATDNALINGIGSRLNAITEVANYNPGGADSYIVSGSVELQKSLCPQGSLMVSEGADLTIGESMTLQINSNITNKGSIINNGWLIFGVEFTEDQINALNLEGSGIVMAYDSSGEQEEIYYTNAGERMHDIYINENTGMDFTKLSTEGSWNEAATLEDNGYKWESNTNTLTIKNLMLHCSYELKNYIITLPDNSKLVIEGVNSIVGDVFCNGQLTVSGDGTLFVEANNVPLAVVKEFTLESGTLNLSDGDGASLWTMGNVNIKDGTLNTISPIWAMGADINISGGNVKSSGLWTLLMNEDRISASETSSVNITGGKVQLISDKDDDDVYAPVVMSANIDIRGMKVVSPAGAVVGEKEIALGEAGTITCNTFLLNGEYVTNLVLEKDNGGAGNTGNGGNSGGGGGGSSNTTTTTEKNPDGSTTTKVTNSTTGTVTETTKGLDGSTTVTETKKDGTVTETVKDTDGNTTETVKNTDGSIQITDKKSDGMTTVTNTDTNGKTTAEITIPTASADKEVKVDIPAKLGSADGTVSVKITYPDGKTETVKCEYSGSSSSSGSLSKSSGTVNIPVTGSAAIEIMDDFVPLAAAPQLTFTDVSANHWSYDAVQYAYQNNLFKGISDTEFGPDVAMTRGMLVTVLYRMENAADASASAGFTDVSSGSYYEAAVNWASANGIVNGMDEKTFAPDTEITREQMSAILYRYAQYKNIGITGKDTEITGFADVSDIAAYAQEAMRWSVSNGLIKGSDSKVDPQGSATRAQVATILMRYCEDIAK